jgi:hypothetical protein
MRFALLMGMANPIPCAFWYMAVLIPYEIPFDIEQRSPAITGIYGGICLNEMPIDTLFSAHGPIQSAHHACGHGMGKSKRIPTDRFRALTTPVVTVWESPKGFPMAITVSPIIMSSELPIIISGSFRLTSICRTAKSERGSEPSTRPL